MLGLFFCARNGAHEGSNGRARTSGHDDGGLVEVHRRARCWSSAIASSAYAWMLYCSRAKKEYELAICGRGTKRLAWDEA